MHLLAVSKEDSDDSKEPGPLAKGVNHSKIAARNPQGKCTRCNVKLCSTPCGAESDWRASKEGSRLPTTVPCVTNVGD